MVQSVVEGDNIGNYEQYLIEIINASSWMITHFDTPFCAPARQSNGECDAYAGEYGLDFKLIASETAMQAKSIFSFREVKNKDGSWSTCAPKNKDGKIDVTRFPQALRYLKPDELPARQAQVIKKHGVDRDISNYLKKITVNKNLLLFFPFRFSFDQPGDPIEDIRTIVDCCSADFRTTLAYRSEMHPTLDTFFVFMYEYCFVLCQWITDQLIFLEAVDIENSKTFMHISQHYCDEWSERYDAFLPLLKSKTVPGK